MTKMTRAEYARHRGVSRSRISHLTATGRIPVDDTGKIDSVAADAILDDKTMPPSGKVPDVGLSPYDEARARKMKADADLAELKVKEAEGRLIPLDVIKRADFATIRRWRDQLLGLADRISPKVAATTDERECNAIIDDETRTILNEMAAGVDYGRAADKASDE